MYEVRNIAFTYTRRKVLRDVSFVVSPGETVAIVGNNGTGKTTLLKVLATLTPPDSGFIRINGQDALEDSLKYRQQLGYMSETPALYEDMKVKAYLEYRAAIKGEAEKRIKKRVEKATDTCQISDLLSTQIRHLSAGQKKRVALADAILLHPRVLLLDDFLAGMDHTMREAAGSIVSNVASFASVIITGHEIADLAKWTTRFLVLSGGVISASIPSAGMDPQTTIRRIDNALGGSRI